MVSIIRTPMTQQSWASAFGMPVHAFAAVQCALAPARLRTAGGVDAANDAVAAATAKRLGTSAWRPPSS